MILYFDRQVCKYFETVGHVYDSSAFKFRSGMICTYTWVTETFFAYIVHVNCLYRLFESMCILVAMYIM